MHEDLKEVIETSRRARDAVLAETLSVKAANSVAAHNHAIVSAHALDLRQRIFDSEQGVLQHRLTKRPAEAA